MKRCPSCQRTYDDAQGFCLTDGAPLVSDAPQAYDPAQTLVASPPPPPASPPASDIPPTQVVGTEQPLNYQAYQPQQPPQPPQQQWAPPQQQWGAPPPPKNNKKIIILAVSGLLVAVGVGLLIYFLTGSSNRFVGTWVEENRPASKPSKFTNDGKITEQGPGGNEVQQGTYTATGDKAVITISRGTQTTTLNATLESSSRMRIEGPGRAIYLIRK